VAVATPARRAKSTIRRRSTAGAYQYDRRRAPNDGRC
jgi:hypothetical protein